MLPFYHPILATVNGGISKNTLSKASLDILVDGLIASALNDTGSTEHFISKAFPEKHSLKIHSSSGHVSLASFSQTCKIDVYRLVKSVVEDNAYYNTKLLVNC